MNFFWSGDKLSWLRFLTIKSFKRHNPDWEIRLHTCETSKDKKWLTGEVQDNGVYDGSNFLHEVELLGVTVSQWSSPIQGLSAPHASDLLQWDILSTNGGFYADMDILFVKPLVYNDLSNFDVVYCNHDRHIAIGFYGATPSNPFFRDIQQVAFRSYKDNSYQSAGALALYSLASAEDNWFKQGNAAEHTMRILQKKHQSLKYLSLSSHTFYFWAWNDINSIWTADVSLPNSVYGIHWFGGAALSQGYNNILTPETIKQAKKSTMINLISEYA